MSKILLYCCFSLGLLCLQPLNAQQSRTCSDAIFLRRVYLKTTGMLPEPKQTIVFIRDKDPEKRTKIVDQLLDSPDHAHYMLMRWGDILRIKSEFPSNLWPNGVQAYNRWLYEKLLHNTPYNQWVHELLTSKGSNFKSPAVNFFRAFQDRKAEIILQNIHLLFMGEQNTPLELSPCFSQLAYKSTKEWKEEIVYPNVMQSHEAVTLTLPKGKQLNLTPYTDWRETYADWLTASENDQFVETIINRMWFWMTGKGLFCAPEPQKWPHAIPRKQAGIANLLMEDFIHSDYDLKALTKRILLSKEFQQDQPAPYLLQERLPAEVIVDAIAQITNQYDTYQSRVPEPFTIYPKQTKARDLGDATVSSPTLELFGRASRDVSLESQRKNQITDKQLLYLMNSNELEGKIRKSKLLSDILKSRLSSQEMIRRLYLTILVRYPSAAEIKTIQQYQQQHKLSLRDATIDLCWTLINSNEFLFFY